MVLLVTTRTLCVCVMDPHGGARARAALSTACRLAVATQWRPADVRCAVSGLVVMAMCVGMCRVGGKVAQYLVSMMCGLWCGVQVK